MNLQERTRTKYCFMAPFSTLMYIVVVGDMFIIVHESVHVNTKEVKKVTEFEKTVKMKLLNEGKSQKWLINEVRTRTGMFCDTSYLSRIFREKRKAPKIVCAIQEILDIKALEVTK